MPRDGAHLTIPVEAEGTVVGNRAGYLRFAIAFLAAALTPVAQTDDAPSRVVPDLASILTEGSRSPFEVYELDESIISRGPAESEAVPVGPSHKQRFAVALQPKRLAAFSGDGAEAVVLVDLLNPGNGRDLEAGLARILKERERAGADDSAVGYAFRDFEIAFDVGVLGKLHVREIRETLTADFVVHEVLLDVEVKAGEILNRITVLTRRQPPDGDAARIAIMFPGVFFQAGSYPVDRFGPLFLRRLGHLRRGHSLLLQDRGDFFPFVEARSNIGLRRHLLKVDATHVGGRPVADKAVLLEDGRDGE